MTNKPLLLAGGAGAISALLAAAMVGNRAEGSSAGSLERTALVTVTAPLPPAEGERAAALPAATLQSLGQPAAVSSVAGGAAAGQAGIWSKPAEFAPPD